MIPAFFGIAGPALSADERAFFRDADPAGYILFQRNCVDPAQMRALTADLRDLAGRDLPVLIDQEGGRVARMRPPAWPAFPAQGVFARLWDVAPGSAMQAARWNAAAIGLMLRDVGVNVDCLPLLDVSQPETHDVIGDRALGGEPMMVASLGRAVLDGLAEGGVIGVVKHMPGHGRATVDSHLALPVVHASAETLETDLKPFRSLADRAVMAMTAHVVYPAWDAARPATLSPDILRDVVRGSFGYDGLLMTDDIDMKALSGTPADKASAALAAGCDIVLDCWARMDEMVAIAAACPAIADTARARLDRAMASIADAAPVRDFDWLVAERDRFLALA